MSFAACRTSKPLPSHFHYLSFCLLLTLQHILRFHLCLSFGGRFSPDPQHIMQVFIDAPCTFSHLRICPVSLNSPLLSPVGPLLLRRSSLQSHVTFSCFLCVCPSLPRSPAHVLLSAACMSLLWPSCQLLVPPVYTHTYTSVYMPMTVWRSRLANSKHKERREAGKPRRKVEQTIDKVE